MPRLELFKLDEAVLAPTIYRSCPHLTTGWGLIIERKVRRELRELLKQYIAFSGCSSESFLRIDVIPDQDMRLHVIEINEELQEGWGIALNLLESAGKRLPDDVFCDRFPKEIIVYNDDYIAEFELAEHHFRKQYRHWLELVNWRHRPGKLLKGPHDDKVHVARFSRLWSGKAVLIPRGYCDPDPWHDIPQEAVFKFRTKTGKASRRAGFSVAHRGDPCVGKFARRSYQQGDAIAQDYIEPYLLGKTDHELGEWLEAGGISVCKPYEQPMQAVIMCSGSEPITGYVQVARPGTFVINDKDTKKGPLVFT